MYKKKIIGFLLLLIICFCNATTAKADEIITYSDGFYQYHLGEGYVSLCGYFGSQEEVNIPSSIAGRPVVIIEKSTFNKNTRVKEIYIPDTVTYIEENTFIGLKNLKKIVADTVDLKIVADEGVEIEYLRGNPDKVDTELTILVAACNQEMTTIEAFLSGGGKYNVGDTVILSAPVLPGKTFLGWYKGILQVNADNSVTVTEKGDRISGKATCKVTVESGQTSFVAVYEEVDANTRITLGEGIENVTYTVTSKNGTSTDPQTYNGTITCQLGDTITLMASEHCVGWKNVYGVYVTRNKEYTFTISGKVEGLTPVFHTVEEDKILAIFESFYKQELDRKIFSTEAEIMEYDIPEIPLKYGHTAKGWCVNNTVITATEELDINEAVKNTIQNLLKNGASVVTLKAEYAEDVNQTCTVTVKNGEGTLTTNTYKLSEIVKVCAADIQGKMFSHWTDENGNIMSYNAEYSFYAVTNITLEAVYVTNQEQKATPAGITEILYANKETEESTGLDRITMVSLSTVPSGYTIHKAGVIASFKDKLGNQELTDKTAQYIAADEWGGTTYRYTLTIRKTQSTTICARAYLIYSDAEGNMYTVYGDMVER